MPAVVLLGFMVVAASFLVFRRSYARTIGVDPEATGWRRFPYVAGFIVGPIVVMALTAVLIVAAVSS